MIKAIDTRYNNHLFRSRLEARWAVYFDSLSVKWEYEPEGYELSDGSKYLPDFWLPDHDVYAEVKPWFKFDSRWHLFINGIGKPIIILAGVPRIYEQRLFYPGHKYPLTVNDYCPAFLLPPGFEFFPFFSGSVDLYYKDEEIFKIAVERACSARFE